MEGKTTVSMLQSQRQDDEAGIDFVFLHEGVWFGAQCRLMMMMLYLSVSLLRET
jgi:hypothetical protein